jgi:hypothetical protein
MGLDVPRELRVDLSGDLLDGARPVYVDARAVACLDFPADVVAQ